MELNFKEFGQGDPIIILHGLFGTLDNWQTIAKKLSENYTVYIIDQRNHGRSPHSEPLDYPTMAEAYRLAAINGMNRLNRESRKLVG